MRDIRLLRRRLHRALTARALARRLRPAPRLPRGKSKAAKPRLPEAAAPESAPAEVEEERSDAESPPVPQVTQYPRAPAWIGHDPDGLGGGLQQRRQGGAARQRTPAKFRAPQARVCATDEIGYPTRLLHRPP